MTDIADFEVVLGSGDEGVVDIRKLLSLCDVYGISDWVVFDSSVVRGLAYYTGVVFEGFDRRQELRAICGGGRYDRLVESMGGEALGAVGFGFGDAVIMELLTSLGLLPKEEGRNGSVVVFPFSEDLRETAVQVTCDLRNKGVQVDLVLDQKKAKWAFQRADRIGATYVVMVAPDELSRGEVIVKNLITGEQQPVPLKDIYSSLGVGSR